MAYDNSEEGPFLSALKAFSSLTAYANVSRIPVTPPSLPLPNLSTYPGCSRVQDLPRCLSCGSRHCIIMTWRDQMPCWVPPH